MEILRLIGLILGEVVVGTALLCLASGPVLRRMLRLEKAAAALLLGIAFVPYVSLVLLLAGGRLSGWVLGATCGAGIGVLLLRKPRWKDLLAEPGPRMTDPLLPVPIRAYVVVALGALLSWVLLAAVLLPPGDYDSFSLWSYRVRVLLAERVFYCEALLDPIRFIPARQHPYLLPVMEAAHALALGSFSFAARHVPHILAYGAFLLLSLAAVRREKRRGRWNSALALLGALVLLPAAGAQLSQESVREILIGYYGFAAVYFLARWAESPRWFPILVSAGLGIVTQQIKVEGIPIIGGLAVGAILIVAAGPARFRLLRGEQLLAAGTFALLLAAPYAYVLNFRMPDPTAHGYDFTADLNPTVLEQARSVMIVAWITVSELFARPELYGFAGFAAVWGLLRGWSRRNALVRLALLASPVACLLAIVLIYVGRNGRLPPERNVTFSRRMMCCVPALTFAALTLPATRSARRRLPQTRKGAS